MILLSESQHLERFLLNKRRHLLSQHPALTVKLPNRKEDMLHPVIRDLLRNNDLKHDPWGTAMDVHFAICDVLDYHGYSHLIPGNWGYRASALGTDGPTSQSYTIELLHKEFETGSISTSGLVQSGIVLNRYEDLLKRAGRDY